MAVDPDGTVYFTDRTEGRLWQRAPNGSLTILLERLEQPRGLVRGEDGTLYFVADGFREQQEGPRSKGVLLKRTPDDGAVTILAENFRKPKQLAFDKDNRLLLSTRGGLRAQADPEGEETQEERDDDEAAAADAEEDEETEGPPEAFRGTVFHINPEDGQIFASHPGFRRPSGVVADEAGTLTVVAKGYKPKEPPLKGTLFQIKANGDVTVLLEERFKRPKGLVRDVLGFFFLAVRRDPDHPKDGGLILKVASDGSFTRFAQGFERPWGLAFDPQGNFYVSDPKAGRIYRFLAPAPPSLADHPATTREAQVTLAGTTEPEAKITVRGGKEEVTTLANSEGRFTLDVFLLPDQVNQLKVYATGAKGEGLTSAPALAPVQQQTTPPPPSIVLVIQITEPSSGATITSDSVLVRGLVDAGGLEVGVSVNGIVSAVQGNTFAVLVPVSPDTTTLAAIATTAAGATASQSIAITVAGTPAPKITLIASPASGVAPLRVTWHVSNETGRALARFEFDETGAGTFGAPTTTFDGVQTTYTTPGFKFPTLRATDDQGTTYTATTVVSVEDPQTVTTRFQTRWSSFKGRLQAGDVSGALTHLAPTLQPRFQRIFQQLGADLPTIAASLGDLEVLGQVGDLTEAVIVQQENGVPFLHFIYFRRDSRGRWLIEEM